MNLVACHHLYNSKEYIETVSQEKKTDLSKGNEDERMDKPQATKKIKLSPHC